jgi:hypothetical protein
MASSHLAIFRELENLTCREMFSSDRLVQLILAKVNLLDAAKFEDEHCARLARVFLELLKDVLTERYQDLSIRAFAHVCVALDYFLDPVESVPGAKPDSDQGGLVDDMAFMLQTETRFHREIQKYKEWKKRVERSRGA